jgi:hypothetical protein
MANSEEGSIRRLSVMIWVSRDLGELVEEFISEFEGVGKNADLTRWGRFTDVRGIDKEMIQRLDTHFQKWLNP